ncbi:MAG TPA: ribosome silencing factor [Gammaproteobacteria bacterium]|jgi:ribosome-associated protein
MPGRKKTSDTLDKLVLDVLDDLKAQSVLRLDVRHLTSLMDTMIIASGGSDRHVRAVAQALLERCRQSGYEPVGVEGEAGGEWVLVDLGDTVVHIMLPKTRDFYSLENLWDISARRDVGESG